jgi:hypothetical protein
LPGDNPFQIKLIDQLSLPSIDSCQEAVQDAAAQQHPTKPAAV